MKFLRLFLFFVCASAFAQTVTHLGGVQGASSVNIVSTGSISLTAGRTETVTVEWCGIFGDCGDASIATTDLSSVACTGETLVQKLLLVNVVESTPSIGFAVYQISSAVGGTETCTANFAHNLAYPTISVDQMSAGAFTFDKCGTNAASTANPAFTTAGSNLACTTPNGNLAASNELIFSAMETQSGSNTVPSGYTSLYSPNGYWGFAWGVAGSSGSPVTATWTASAAAYTGIVYTLQQSTTVTQAVQTINGVPALISYPSCASGASPAVCSTYSSGAVAVPTGSNPTLVVDTTAVTATSHIFLIPDDTLTISATTCNTTAATLSLLPFVSARTAGTSFTITIEGTVTTNPVCVSYLIVD